MFLSSRLLGNNAGERIEDRISQHFTPSFFTTDLYERDSLLGRVSYYLYSFCNIIGLSKRFKTLDLSDQLFLVILKAERCWLAALLDQYSDECMYHGAKEEGIRPTKVRIQNKLSVVVSKKEQISSGLAKKRLNELTVLTHSFYDKHHSGHNYVTGRVVSTYLDFIFS